VSLSRARYIGSHKSFYPIWDVHVHQLANNISSENRLISHRHQALMSGVINGCNI